MATGLPQIAMVHVGVETAKGLGGQDRYPFHRAGRTPITEERHPASRSLFIHWGQETFDQEAIVREFVK
ncbi:MAG: hypothetical protein ACOWYE_14715 [Desulfatiglandales bacterium]